MSLLGAEWVLYLLLALSVFSVTLIIERARFYRDAGRGIADFRTQVRRSAAEGDWDAAAKAARARAATKTGAPHDLEAEMTEALIARGKAAPEILTEIAHDAVLRGRMGWERNLSTLATIGNIAPFVGLFGTVLGIIKAFHELSQQASGAQTVSAGISDALVATAIGILVAIPAVVSFNLFQRRVKTAVGEAEALKSFLIGKLAGR